MEKISLDLSNSQLQGAQIKEAQKELQVMGKEIAEIEELLLQKMEQQIQTEEALNLLLNT